LDKKVLQQKSLYFSDKIIMEAGCGTGKNTQWISQIAKQVYALDFSANMLKKAKNKISNRNIVFINADLFNWPFSQNSFDIITINLVLEHIKELSPIFKSSYQSLKTPGLLLVNELHPQKQLCGSKAHFETNDKKTVELDSFFHPKNYFYKIGKEANFDRINIVDCYENINDVKPRILSMEFFKD
jgi:ubiquinone/menaquinone biosynthesis C-methylase UbiE